MAYRGNIIAARLEELGARTADKDGVIWRNAYTPEYRLTVEMLMTWMREAGLNVRIDSVGNIFGRLEGKSPRTILTGSHLDTVKNGGKYDGAAGIITGIQAIQDLKDQFGTSAKSIEVVAMIEEEGSRFNTSYIGSRAITGKLTAEDLEEEDEKGIKVRQAMREYGFDPLNFSDAARSDIDAFIELHIEQGPKLEKLDCQIGIVESIVGLYGYNVTIKGRQNHAGTVPMEMRKDPVVAAAIFIEEFTRITRETSPSAVCTFGKIDVRPGSANVIAKEVTLSLDLRDGVDGGLDKLEAALYAWLEEMRKAGYGIACEKNCDEKPARLAKPLVDTVAAAVDALGYSGMRMNSGAGHDSQVFADKVPTGMVFIPSAKGISHSPDEFTAPEDLGRGASVLQEVLHRLAY